jgi:hypothetical protein
MGGAGRVRSERAVDGVEDELGEIGPDAAPAAREGAGARGGGNRAEAAQDAMQQLIGEAADVVFPAPSLPRTSSAAVLHDLLGFGWRAVLVF